MGRRQLSLPSLRDVAATQHWMAAMKARIATSCRPVHPHLLICHLIHSKNYALYLLHHLSERGTILPLLPELCPPSAACGDVLDENAHVEAVSFWCQ